MSLLFIFDMDDVLYGYDWRSRMAGMTRLTGHSLEELRRRWWNDEGEWAAEAGAFATADEYLSAFESAVGMSIDEDDWVRVRGGAMTVRPACLEVVRQAAELGQVTLLTNNGPLVSKHIRTLAPDLTAVFGDHLFTSSDYGARKPNPLVFQRVLSTYSVDAESAFFTDDMAINVSGAASLGITAHRYRSPKALRRAIERFSAKR